MSKSILRAFAPLLFGVSMSAGAQTVLNPGQDIYTNGLNIGQYNLQLGGDVTWQGGEFNINSAARANINIDGNNKNITLGTNSTQELLFINQNNTNIAITNATINSRPFTGPRWGLFQLESTNVTASMNLEGTTFKDIGPNDFNTYASADYGPIVSVRGGTNSTLNIAGGSTGVLFQGNHGLADQPGAIGLYGPGNTINFTGKVTFDSNYTGNYGGAVTVYDVGFQTMSFAGETTFTNNHSAVFGGAIDFWGGSANMTYNGPATFSGNYVYGATGNSASSPSHVLDQHSRGGAINIGYVDPGANGVTLTFNGATTFNNNYVVEAKNNRNALGGAVSAYGNGANRNYFMNFNGATTFDSNYVYSYTGSGYGGAIYYDAGTSAQLNLGPGSQVINNYAKTLGGGIYLQTGTINLDANGGDILFQGNRQGATFDPTSGGLYAPVVGSGVPNAIYLGGTGSLNLVAALDNKIDFYDPIASAAGITVTVNKSGNGSVIFHGNSANPGDVNYNSDIRTNTNVGAGTFALTDAVIYGNTSFGTFTVNGGTVQGSNASTLRAQNININPNGQVRVEGGIFNLSAGNAITSTSGVFSGFGTIAAPSISLLSGTNATADSGETLTLDALLTNTGSMIKLGLGTVVLTKANTYSGATTIIQGTVQAGIANTISNSSGLSIFNGTFDLNNFSQNLKGLSGGANAAILMGSSTATTLTVNSAANSVYAGTITGAGNVFKQGAGQLTLSGNVSLTGAGSSDVQTTAGTLLINGGNTVSDFRTRIYGGSTVTVSNGSTLSSSQATYVGDTSGGTLNVLSGGQATGGDLDIGQSATTATATISGSGSAVNVTGAINAGWTGSGVLQIDSGATATSGSGVIGALSGGSGTATVDGAGSAWTMNGSGGLVVGNAGAGTMTIQNGGIVSTTIGGVRLGNGANSGTLNLNASSVLATNSLSKGTGTGQFNVNGGTLRALSSNASFISGFNAGNLALLAGGGTIDSNGFNIGAESILSGAGKLTKTGAGILTLTGVNTYAGGTEVSAGTLRLTGVGSVSAGAVNIASGATMLIDAPSSGSYTFNNSLNGSGLLQVGLSSASDTFAFSAGVGSLFTGTARLGNSTFTLSGNNTTTLSNATLQLDSGNTTIVGNGPQTIGNLTMNGGTLQFANLASGGVINTGTLSLNNGSVAIDPNGIVNAADNILLQDSGINYRLVTAGSVTGSASNLTLTDLAGNPVTDTADIVQNSNVVAVGTYGFALGDDATGLYTRYQLTQLALQAGQTTTLSGDSTTPAGADELNAKVTGSGNLAINATTSITLNNDTNDYTGSTNVNTGSLILGSDNALGQTSALNIFSGGTVDMNGKTQTVGALSDAGSLLMNAGSLTVLNGGTFLGTISGTAGSFTLAGGTQALGGANTYTGATTINNGATLQIGLYSTSGSYAGDIVDNGLVNFARSDTLDYAGAISGSGGVGVIGSGTIIFTGANTYTGGTTISDGTLQIGNNNITGSITGDVVNNGGLVFQRTNFYNFAGAISGNGTVTQGSGGTLTLSGNSTYTGATSVNTGTLLVDGTLGNTAVTVANGATLGGHGAIGGPVTIANGGHLSPGNSPGTLTTGTLTLNTGSFLDFELNTPNVVGGATNDLLTVNGDLTLSGILNVSNTGNTALAAGKYRLIDYTGSLLNPGGTLTFGTLPGGTLGRDLFVQTSITGQVNLISSFGLNLNVWDGGNTALHDNSVVNGGDGVWDNANRNWTTDSGDINGLWSDNAVAQFGGTAGTVTVSTANGPVNLSGAQFTVSGYNITGGALTTNTANTEIGVGGGMTATISSVIDGSGGINKTDLGTLVFNGLNTYTGGTTVSAGTLQLTGAGTISSGAAQIAAGGTLFINVPASGNYVFNNALTGTGLLQVGLASATDTFNFGAATGPAFAGTVQLGNSTFTLSGANATALTNATLQLGSGNTTTVGSGTQSIGNLTYNGGTTIFSSLPSGIINTGTLTLNSGNVRIDPSNATVTGDLLTQDDGVGQQLISAASVSGLTASLTLTDLSGNVLNTRNAGIVQGGNTVAIGTYDYSLSTTGSAGSGLYAQYSLTQLALQAGQTTVLSGDATTPVGANEFHARITGSGNLTISPTVSITLNNSGNDYTGQTVVSGGTLIVGANNALGATTDLRLGGSAIVDLNGKTQAIGGLSSFNTTTEFNVNGGNLTLNLADSTSVFNGSLTGSSGSITIDKANAGLTLLHGASTYTGLMTINSGSDLLLSGTASYVGDITNNGRLAFANNPDLTYNGVVSGTGSLLKFGPDTRLMLGGINTYSGGTSITEGTISATSASALGSGVVSNGSALELAFTTDGTMSNQLTGSGSLTKVGSSIATLTGVGSSQGAVSVNAGTLNFAQSGVFNAASLSTASGATTSIDANSTLNLSGALTQSSGSTLTVGIGSAQPVINAGTAALDGALNISGFSTSAPNIASELPATLFTVLHTTGGITGDFASVSLGGATSPVDYLTLSGRKSADNRDYNVGFGLTWLAGPAQGNGVFTLASGNTFNVDVVLTNQTGPFTSGWDGGTLIKAGDGTLILSAANTYTGDTLINAGTLQTGIANAFINSGNVTVSNGATLNLNGFSQQADNLRGGGNITLGSGALTVNNLDDTAFSGVISGTGSLSKIGSGTLTLSNANTYNGGTNIDDGVLLATNAGALGNGAVTNNAQLQLDFTGILANQLTGTGSLTKQGSGTVTLTGAGSTQGGVTVNAGTLNFAQSGAFSAASLSTISGATISIAANSTLSLGNELTQKSNSTLSVALGNTQPIITASTADLDGTLNISGFSATAPNTASALANTLFTIIRTTGGINGDFSSVNLGGAVSLVDYLTLAGSKSADNLDYNVGFGLTWLAGPAQGNGVFTLASGNTFNVDVVLTNQTGPFTSGWDGGTLIKAGDGTLILSAANTYTGDTLINAGTLQTGITNAFINSADVIVADGATLDLNGFAQQANNLSGAGNVTLGSGALTVNSLDDTAFSGVISGTGSLSKIGSGTFTLSNANTYNGGTTINDGILLATNAGALSSGAVTNNAALQLDFTGTLANQLAGTGSLTKQGSGTVTLTGAGSTQGAVSVNAGTLNFAQSGVFNADSLSTVSGATTSIAANSTLNLSGALTQNGGSTLTVGIGSTQPVITANSASLDGTLNVSGFSTSVPNSASALTTTEFTVISTISGITGDFASVNLGGASSPVDYLTLAGRKSADGLDYNVGFGLTWLAGPAQGNGVFTLASGNTFNVDVALADQTGPFTSGWDGKTLTKAGAGTLILSAANTYTGDTLINAGTLQTGIANAFINSANVTVASGATLDLNGFAQQANNLSGAGNVTLGSGALTVNSLTNTAFSGVISGSGSLSKIGGGTLTLSNTNAYSGGTNINDGTLLATNAGALGSGVVTNNAALQLDFTGALANQLAGTGSLTKQGSGTVTLTGAGSTQGAVSVNAGTLNFAQSGVFNAASLSTASSATTSIAANSTLNLSGTLVQNSGSTLNVALGTTQPIITASNANLDGTLNISGFSATAPNTASALVSTLFNIIHTTGGITGDFASVNLGGATNSLDYLTLAAAKSADGLDYNVGFGLTWLAGPTQGNGVFTLASGNTFNVDVALADQTGLFTSGWDGKTLTKAGAGTLILSAANTYTGDTLINAGTLQTGIANAFINSANVTVASGATLDLNGFAQQANNLSGAGNVTLGSGTLTVNSLTNTAFSGVISGTGSLSKIGGGTLTLSNTNGYSGGTNINDGTLLATNAGALGSGVVTNNAALQLDFTGALANQLAGTGSLTKQGSGTVTLTGAGSTQGAVSVNAGTLNFAQSGVFNAASLNTASGAATSIAANSTLNLSGALTQSSGSTLSVALGSTQPIISAASANLDGTLNISGFSATAPNTASALASTLFNIIHTTGGITGDFASVNLGGATNSLDYLTLAAAKSADGLDYNVGFGLTWLAGPTQGNGVFTLASGNTFNVDVALADQTGPFTSGWDGTTLIKAGDGTLILSAANTYTGDTLINAGVLQTGIANALINSANVTVSSGATLNLNGFAQQANNLRGGGNITLGSGTLTTNNLDDTAFSGVISGTGSLSKIGGGTLTLSNANAYSGGSTINDGTLLATNAGALGSGAVTNNAALQLDFTGTLANQLAGTGSLTKQGSGTVTLTGAGSTQGAVSVNSGELRFAQSGAFNAASLTTASGAVTGLAADSTVVLSGALTQSSGSTLNVAIGSTQPIISAASASLDGTLKITGINASLSPTRASELPNTQLTVIQTTGGITGDFASVDLGGATSSVDYITIGAGKSADGNNYNVGYGLTWLVGAEQGNGVFTLASGSTFNVDVALADQTGPFTSGWDGKTLTKAGAGTLILSAANTYTGDTLINSGTLQTGIADAMINSANVTVANSATLDLGGFNQQVNNLSGTGSITLGNADLTVNSLANTSFGGSISGNGQLIKTGSGTFTVSGTNFYGGGTTVSGGRLVGTQVSALGIGGIQNNAELELAFATDQTLNNPLSGSGTLIKTGAGTALVNTNGFSQGNVAVDGGKLQFAANNAFNTTGNYQTANGATTAMLADATLNVGGQFGVDGKLEIVAGNSQPVVTADTAVIGSGATFNLSGYSAPASTSASQLASSQFTVIQTAAPGNLTGSFAEIDLGGSSEPEVDYLTLTTIQDTQSLKIGVDLVWYAGHTVTPQKANGTFTLVGSNEYFDLDLELANEAANAVTGWDGISLTKAGAGTLELSKANTYTGETKINGGTLRAGTVDAIADSSRVSIADGATLDLNGNNQRLNNLNGAGNATLGGAALTANNTEDTVFSGVISGVGSLTKTGNAALILAGENAYGGGTTISAGTLQLGNGDASGSVIGNIVNNANLVFNRSDAYQYNDVISGTGQVVQQGSGSTLFSQNQTYTGNTSVNAGALILINEAQLSGTPLVSVAQNAVLGGYGGVSGDVVNNGLLAVADAVPGFANSPAGNFIVGGNLTNNGEIRMASPLPASTLVVNGNYVGNNGLLTLSTVLGGDDSATDKLIVHGNTSGSTRVVVNNSGGGGAQTNNGIQIIQVDGQSAGQFSLASRVTAGAYEYSLYQGLPGQSDGNWYLRSVGGEPNTPQWQPEIGAYLGNQSLTSVMQMHTLYDREGGQLNQGAGSFWLRVAGGKIDSKAAQGNVDMNSDYTLVHFGGDLAAWRDGAQRLQVGLMGSWGQGDTDSTGNRNPNGSRSTAHGKVDGYSVGAYATWFADADTRRGAYVDSWLQYGWYNNDATGQGKRTDSYDSNLFTVSLESGYTFQLSETATQQWRLTPQAQVAYSRYSADRFTDVSGTVIDGQNQDLWTTRLGARLSGQMQVKGNPVQPFAEVNWWHSGQNASVSLGGQSVDEDTPRDRAELKVGVEAAFGKRWSGWAHVGVQSDFNDYQRLEGMAGIRFVW